MQEGVRVWYFGGVGTNVDMSSDSEEAYLLSAVDAAGAIAESNEDDNEYTRTLTPLSGSLHPRMQGGKSGY